jgi:hypothetical protein
MKIKNFNKQKEMFDVIHSIDCNISPVILSLGSELFKYITQINNDCYFLNISGNYKQLSLHYFYSEDNLCKVYDWLKNNNFIYYSKSNMKYCLTQKTINLLNLNLE